MNNIICGDCAEVLSGFEPESIDLTVTSPPYDKLRKYKGFVFDFEAIAKELHRTTKQGGVVVWVVGDSTINGSETGTSFRQALYFKEIGFNLHDTMIYRRWSGPLTHNRYEQEFEYMFVFSKGRPKTFNPIMIDCAYAGTGGVGKYVKHDELNKRIRSETARKSVKQKRILGNVWDIKTSAQMAERYGHAAPFPEALANDHILSWSNVGDIILDPMCGSGTTLKMAKKLGRNYVGIEISPEYVKIAEERLGI